MPRAGHPDATRFPSALTGLAAAGCAREAPPRAAPTPPEPAAAGANAKPTSFITEIVHGIAHMPVDVDAGLGLLGQIDHSQDMRRNKTDDGDLHLFDLVCMENER